MFVAGRSLERRYVSAIGIVEEDSIRVVDDAWSGEHMTQGNCPAVMATAEPGDHAVCFLDQALAVLNDAIGTRRVRNRLEEAGLFSQLLLKIRRASCRERV